MLKIAICDDDKQEHTRMDKLCEEYKTSRGCGDIACSFFHSGVDLLSEMKDSDYDLILLDTVMPGYSGVQTAQEIRLFNKMVKIIFISSSSEFVMDSYSVGAYGYLLKPIVGEQIFPMLDKIQAEVNRLSAARRNADSLVLKSREGIVSIPFAHIEFVEVMNKRVYFHLIDGSVQETSASLLDFEPQLLARMDFLKVHRSFLINLRCLQTLSIKGIVTQTGHILPISKAMYPQVKEAYMKYIFICQAKAQKPAVTPKPTVAPAKPTAVPKPADRPAENPNSTHRILLVDDEAEQQNYWAGVLRSKGCTVDFAANAEMATQLVSQADYACIVLDVMLFGEASFSHCKRLHELTSAPVVFLSSLTDSDTQLQGFLSGGIDYITKDTPDDLFWAKIEARIRLSAAGKVLLSFEHLVLDISLRKVMVDGVELLLTPTEFDLLWLLAEHNGRVYTPEELYHAVWGGSQWDGGQSIQVHLSRMRRKLEKACPSHCFIETAWGKGYRFISTTEVVTAGEGIEHETV